MHIFIRSNKSFALIPPYEFNLDIARKVAPLTFMYVMMLALNNLCLQYVEVTFYQVSYKRSLVIGLKTIDRSIIKSVLIIYSSLIN